MNPIMLIIDSQVHIWAPETAEKPYAREDASPPHRPVPLGHDELLREMDGAGVSALRARAADLGSRPQRHFARSGAPVSRPLSRHGPARVDQCLKAAR